MRNREVGTKHVYVGESRIVSKLLKQDKPGANPRGQVPLEKDQYFYHADHLGSTGYVTDANGDLYQHVEYFPFGETWVEESSNTQRTPYLFTSKELDEETGLYYYGARYYDPRTSVWQSADPALGEYLPNRKGGDQRDQDTSKLPGMGGVYNSLNLSLYTYSYQNPVKYKDPDGRSPTNGGQVEDRKAYKVYPIAVGAEVVAGKIAGPIVGVAVGAAVNHASQETETGRLKAVRYTAKFQPGTMGHLVHKTLALIAPGVGDFAAGDIGKHYQTLEETTGFLSRPVTRANISWLAENETKWWRQQEGLSSWGGLLLTDGGREKVLLTAARVLCRCWEIP